jgi:hypothetical protein
MDNSNTISVSMLGQIQNSLSDLTNSVDLLTVAVATSLYDLTATLDANNDSSNDFLNNLIKTIDISNNISYEISTALKGLAEKGIVIDGSAISITLDTKDLTKAIAELKPSKELVSKQSDFYDKQNKVADFQTTPLDVTVAPSSTKFPAEKIIASPLELQARKSAQDYAYVQSKHSFEYDDNDFDFSLGSLTLPTFAGIEKALESAGSFPDYSKVADSEFDSMSKMFTKILTETKD